MYSILALLLLSFETLCFQELDFLYRIVTRANWRSEVYKKVCVISI